MTIGAASSARAARRASGAGPPDRCLDGVELGDLAQGLFGDRRGIGLHALHEATRTCVQQVHELP